MDARVIPPAALILTLLIIGYVEGFNNPFAIWNALPVLAAGGLLARGRDETMEQASSGRFGAYGFAAGVILIEAGAHFAWIYNWAGTATGSSTSALMFVTLPVVALAVGGAGMLAGRAIGRFHDHRRGR
ncbi:MAG: hypothetical protein AB1896_22435 [Thermodesulfobacteriota bacterium]